MRVAWRTVGSIITRVWADVETNTDQIADLHRIGIDEITYQKGDMYLMVVVDHRPAAMPNERIGWSRKQL